VLKANAELSAEAILRTARKTWLRQSATRVALRHRTGAALDDDRKIQKNRIASHIFFFEHS